MPPDKPPRAITMDGIRNWTPWVVTISGVLASAAALYARVDSRLALSEARLAVIETRGPEPHRVLVSRVDRLEASREEDRALLRRVLVGIESVDRKLYALVCRNDPAECARYGASLPPP